MSKVVRLSDEQLLKLVEYKALRLEAFRFSQDLNPLPEKLHLDTIRKIQDLSVSDLLSDCLAYAVNSLKYDIESLRVPDPDEYVPFPD